MNRDEMDAFRYMHTVADESREATLALAGLQPDALRALRHTRTARWHAERAQEMLVRALRNPGEGEVPMSWEGIGRALGISRQAAQQRYGSQ